jgi:hypothetical protein
MLSTSLFASIGFGCSDLTLLLFAARVPTRVFSPLGSELDPENRGKPVSLKIGTAGGRFNVADICWGA